MSLDSVIVTYASEGGNAKLLAEDFSKRCEPFGLNVKLVCMNDLGEQGFAKSRLICFVSTTGNGEFPLNGRHFYQSSSGYIDCLNTVNYALFALGSHSYSNFCGAGKKLNDLFTQNQAQALVTPVYADESFDQQYEPWALSLLSNLTGLQESDLREQMADFARKPTATYQLAHKMQLTSDKAEQETFHLVLQAEDEGLAYQPGDVVAIKPENQGYRVKELIHEMVLKSADTLEYEGESVSIYDYLKKEVEITKINANVIKATGSILNDWNLLKLASNETQAQIEIDKHDVLEWLKRYPIPPEKEREWLLQLPVKSPRYYSIASDFDPQQLYLCVGLHRQDFSEMKGCLRQENGLGSGYLCDVLESEDKVELELEVHPGFHLQMQKPMIWVATGTGIAPFIGFLAKLSEVFPSERPQVTLYFGVRDPELDFLYKAFLESCHEEGLIDLKMAFSRVGEKVYVQDVMQQNMQDIGSVLNQEGHVYVCGSTGMWDGVEAVLQHSVLSQCSDMEEAKQAWLEFSSNRLHKDIY